MERKSGSENGFSAALRGDDKLKTCLVTAIVCMVLNGIVTLVFTGINENVRMFLMIAFSFLAIDAASRFAHRYTELQNQAEKK